MAKTLVAIWKSNTQKVERKIICDPLLNNYNDLFMGTVQLFKP
jgi:hypothetical protein